MQQKEMEQDWEEHSFSRAKKETRTWCGEFERIKKKIEALYNLLNRSRMEVTP